MPERAALVLWGALGAAGAVYTIASHARLITRVAGRPVAERGAMAVGTVDWPLATAGRVRFREQIAAGQANSAPLGLAWSWVVAHRPDAPARVHLNFPHTVLYYYTTFYWWPNPVRVNPRPGLVKDDGTLAEHALRVAEDALPSLRLDGYTHVLRLGGPDGVELVPVPER